MVIKKSTLLLSFMLPGLYLSDILYGFLSLREIEFPISPGTVIRGGLFVVAALFSLFYTRLVDKKILFIIWGLVFLTIPGFFQSVLGGYIIYELQFLIKLLYGLFVLLLFIILLKKETINKEQVFEFIEYAAYFIGISIFVMNFMEYGFRTYGYYTTASKGLFSAQNDISLALALAYSVAVYRNILKFKFSMYIFLMLTMLGLLQIGTRASMVALVLVPISCFMVMFFSRSKEWNLKKKIKFMIFFFPLLSLIFMLGFWKGYEEISSSNYQTKKYEQIITGDLPRQRLIDAGLAAISERSSLQNIFGEGGVRFFHRVYLFVDEKILSDKKRPEIDWIELVGAYGIIFTLIIHVCLLMSLFYSIKLFLYEKLPEFGVIAIMLLLFVGHSFFAGHALVSPIVTTLVAAVLGILFTHKVLKN